MAWALLGVMLGLVCVRMLTCMSMAARLPCTQERDAAAELFASVEGIALQKSVTKARTFNIGEVVESKKEEERVLLPEERAAFEVGP